jgi:hypothetical protein
MDSVYMAAGPAPPAQPAQHEPRSPASLLLGGENLFRLWTLGAPPPDVYGSVPLNFTSIAHPSRYGELTVLQYLRVITGAQQPGINGIAVTLGRPSASHKAHFLAPPKRPGVDSPLSATFSHSYATLLALQQATESTLLPRPPRRVHMYVADPKGDSLIVSTRVVINTADIGGTDAMGNNKMLVYCNLRPEAMAPGSTAVGTCVSEVARVRSYRHCCKKNSRCRS